MIDTSVRQYAIEQRMLRMQKEDERLRKLDERFAELDARLSAIVASSLSNSNPLPPTHDKSES
jgi:hypothetical protein